MFVGGYQLGILRPVEVIRDHCGDVVGGVCMQILHVGSPEMVEALASVASATCELPINFSLTPIIFEVDSLLVVQDTKVIGPNTSVLGQIYVDISDCLQELIGSSFFQMCIVIQMLWYIS